MYVRHEVVSPLTIQGTETGYSLESVLHANLYYLTCFLVLNGFTDMPLSDFKGLVNNIIINNYLFSTAMRDCSMDMCPTVLMTGMNLATLFAVSAVGRHTRLNKEEIGKCKGNCVNELTLIPGYALRGPGCLRRLTFALG